MSEYIKKAEELAKKYGIKLKILSCRHGYFFAEDKETRDIYTLRLTRNGKIYTFDFGQSIIKSQKREYEKTPPSIYDVLACLTKYDPGTIDEFVSEFGYEVQKWEDVKPIQKTYKAVVREYRAVNRLFGDIIEELAEIA